MTSIQNEMLEEIERLFKAFDFKPALNANSGSDGVIYVSLPGKGGALDSDPAFSFAYNFGKNGAVFQVFAPNATPELRKGHPDAHDTFEVLYQDRAAWRAMVDKLKDQLGRMKAGKSS